MSLMSLMSLSHLSRAAWIFRSRHVGMSGCRDAHGRLLAGVREAGGLKKAGEAAERCGRDEWFQYVPIGEIGSNVFVALGPL